MNLTPRVYQLAIYNSILQHGNTLVVLPTGLGKTAIGLLLIRDKMKDGRCLFLTPTKPLAKQHVNSIKEVLEVGDDTVTLVTGEKSPKKRVEEYDKKIIVSTPQTIKNDIKNGTLVPKFLLVIFDEAHRAVKNYAYTYVAEACKDALIVGLTASPGGKKERINEVMNALRIQNVEIRTTNDDDVKQYVQQSFIRWIPVSLSPTLKLIKTYLDELTHKHAKLLANLGFPPPLRHKREFIKMRERILRIQHGLKYPALVQYSILLHLMHMSELIETQGIGTLRKYIEKIGEKKSKSAALLMKSQEFSEIKRLCNTDEEHPKLKYLTDLIRSLHKKKIIVFAHYRDQIAIIENALKNASIAAKQFVGKKDGITRKMQEETIVEFRNGKFNVLISTSIGEEGLDIPVVDAVIFYEPVPSEIRSIQRRGRAARFKKGEIYILLTKGTRDEYYYWSSFRKEKRMKEIVSLMQKQKKHSKNDVIQLKKQKISGQTKISHFLGL